MQMKHDTGFLTTGIFQISAIFYNKRADNITAIILYNIAV